MCCCAWLVFGHLNWIFFASPLFWLCVHFYLFLKSKIGKRTQRHILGGNLFWPLNKLFSNQAGVKGRLFELLLAVCGPQHRFGDHMSFPPRKSCPPPPPKRFKYSYKQDEGVENESAFFPFILTKGEIRWKSWGACHKAFLLLFEALGISEEAERLGIELSRGVPLQEISTAVGEVIKKLGHLNNNKPRSWGLTWGTLSCWKKLTVLKCRKIDVRMEGGAEDTRVSLVLKLGLAGKE